LGADLNNPELGKNLLNEKENEIQILKVLETHHIQTPEAIDL